MPDHADGACLCRVVRFRISFPTKWCGHCHCTQCRRAHGAAFVTWVGVESQRFTWLEGFDQLSEFRSSNEAVRRFCSRCGSTLSFESERWPGEVHIVLANLDDPIDREASGDAFSDTAVAWSRHGISE